LYQRARSERYWGGVAFAVDKSIAALEAISRTILAPGKADRVEIAKANERAIFYNIHNFVNDDFVGAIVAAILHDRQLAEARPDEYVAVILGDFNLVATTLQRGRILRIDEESADHAALERFASAGPWRDVFGLRWVPQPDWTRYGAAAGAWGIIDGFFIFAPPWMVLRVRLVSAPLWAAACGWKQGLSDHSRVTLKTGSAPNIPRSQRPIPAWMTKTKEFQIHAELLLQAHGVHLLEPAPRWKARRRCLKVGALCSVKKLSKSPSPSVATKLQIMTSAARALWQNNSHLANLTMQDPPGCPHVCFLLRAEFL
jgi:hypothetical protein